MATEEKRHELSSGTVWKLIELLVDICNMMKLTLCTSTPPSVSTWSGPLEDVEGEITWGASEDDVPDWGCCLCERDEDDEVMAEELVVVVARDDPSIFWFTIICAPFSKPRLDSGSSGSRWSVLGGYPVFTAIDLCIPVVTSYSMDKTHVPAEKARSGW
jgi:hypothetical protein